MIIVLSVFTLGRLDTPLNNHLYTGEDYTWGKKQIQNIKGGDFLKRDSIHVVLLEDVEGPIPYIITSK